jgi:hypothetical protein
MVEPTVEGTDHYSDPDAAYAPAGGSFTYTTHSDISAPHSTVWVRPTGGGAATKVGDAGRFFDWQPCPGGTCPRFTNGIPTTITLVVAVSGLCTPAGCKVTGVSVSGRVTPGRPGQTVTVRLDAWRNGAWKKVATKRPTLSSKSAYRTKFGRPKGTMCRLTATYPRKDPYLASKSVKHFVC